MDETPEQVFEALLEEWVRRRVGIDSFSRILREKEQWTKRWRVADSDKDMAE